MNNELLLFLDDEISFLCNRTRNDHFTNLKQAAKSNFAAVAFDDGH
jgi:hypothetical protein